MLSLLRLTRDLLEELGIRSRERAKTGKLFCLDKGRYHALTLIAPYDYIMLMAR